MGKGAYTTIIKQKNSCTDAKQLGSITSPTSIVSSSGIHSHHHTHQRHAVGENGAHILSFPDRSGGW